MPRTNRQEETTEQQALRHVNAMHDSVNLINQLLADEVTDQDNLETISRNYQHLEIMLGKAIVSESDLDLSAFEPCIAAATAYLVLYPLEEV